MLISAVLPIMTLYRLPHGQYGYSGHIINLPQDVASLADKLPRTPADLDVVVIRKEGAVGHHRDFRVRRSVVLHALEWLTINNTYYRNVTIDHDVLALLPIDGHLSGLVTMSVQSDELEPSAQQDKIPLLPVLSFQCLLLVVLNNKLSDSLYSSNSAHEPAILSWPSSSGSPINEFTTEVERPKKDLEQKEEKFKNMARKERDHGMNAKKRLLEVNQNLVEANQYIKRLKTTLEKQDRECSDLRSNLHFYQDRDRRMKETLKQNEEEIWRLKRMFIVLNKRNEKGEMMKKREKALKGEIEKLRWTSNTESELKKKNVNEYEWIYNQRNFHSQECTINNKL